MLSLLGRYFYNLYIVQMFKIVFSFKVKDNNIVQCLQILDIPITYRNDSVFCQSDSAGLHEAVNIIW